MRWRGDEMKRIKGFRGSQGEIIERYKMKKKGTGRGKEFLCSGRGVEEIRRDLVFRFIPAALVRTASDGALGSPMPTPFMAATLNSY